MSEAERVMGPWEAHTQVVLDGIDKSIAQLEDDMAGSLLSEFCKSAFRSGLQHQRDEWAAQLPVARRMDDEMARNGGRDV